MSLQHFYLSLSFKSNSYYVDIYRVHHYTNTYALCHQVERLGLAIVLHIYRTKPCFHTSCWYLYLQICFSRLNPLRSFYISRDYQKQQSRPNPWTALLYLLKRLFMHQPYQDQMEQSYVAPALAHDSQSYQTLSRNALHCPAKLQEDAMRAQVQ